MFSEVIEGKYYAKFDLKLFAGLDLVGFEKAYKLICENDKWFKKICSYSDGILEYQSETILPDDDNPTKEKVLLVFGNPATHSVYNGMFFFSKDGGKRHSMWGKLAKAGLIEECDDELNDPVRARQEEAKARQKMILTGSSSENYLVGMTTFYSFPTPVKSSFKYSNVRGVEKLFKPVLDKLIKIETDRIINYSFAKDARLVFVQKSSWEHFENESGIPTIQWPIRGSGASGKNLAELLNLS